MNPVSARELVLVSPQVPRVLTTPELQQVKGSVPDPKLLITGTDPYPDPDPQNENQEFRIRILL